MRSLVRLMCIPTAVILAGVPAPARAVPPAGSIPSFTLEERAEAIARPALVFIEARSEGFVRNKSTGQLYSPDPVVIYQRCSGVVVSAQGDVLTATHCVQPTPIGWRDNAFNTLIDRLIEYKQIGEQQRGSFFADLVANAEYGGSAAGTPPDIKVFAQQNALRSGEASTPGKVVGVLPLNEQNVALVRLSVGLPMTELGAVGNIDDQLVLLAYVAVAGAGGDRTFVPRRGAARVSALAPQPGGPSKVDSDLGPYSHGGMAIDKAGRIVGMVNIDRDVKDLPRRAIVPPVTLKSLLDTHGVNTALGPTDIAYRAGLDAYFGGRYSEAISKFDEVLKVVPDHQLASDYGKLAADRRAIEGDPAPSESQQGTYLIAGGIGALVVALIVVPLLLISRRRQRQRMQMALSSSIYAPPISALPISVLPTSTGGYYQPIGGETTGYPTSYDTSPGGQQAHGQWSLPRVEDAQQHPTISGDSSVEPGGTPYPPPRDQNGGPNPWAPSQGG